MLLHHMIMMIIPWMILPVLSKDTCDDPEKDIGYYDSVSSHSIELLLSVISQLD